MEPVIYSDYIKSKAWQKVRQRYIRSSLRSNDCASCGKKYTLGFHLHHKTYKRLGCELLNDLTMLCEPCHVTLHKYHPKKKSLEAWTDEFIKFGIKATKPKIDKKKLTKRKDKGKIRNKPIVKRKSLEEFLDSSRPLVRSKRTKKKKKNRDLAGTYQRSKVSASGRSSGVKVYRIDGNSEIF